jgi:hypothetical protein
MVFARTEFYARKSSPPVLLGSSMCHGSKQVGASQGSASACNHDERSTLELMARQAHASCRFTEIPKGRAAAPITANAGVIAASWPTGYTEVSRIKS